MDIEAYSLDRSTVLIASFTDGFAAGWKMAVPESFKDALDIKQTDRVINKNKERVWTQGYLYDFHEGDTFYDSKLAYSNKWKEVLHGISICVQVDKASPSGYLTYEHISIYNPEIISQIKGDKTSKLMNEQVNIYKQRLDFGKVEFTVYRPDNENNSLKQCESFECSQNDFVAFLQSGVVYTKKQHIDLFEE